MPISKLQLASRQNECFFHKLCKLNKCDTHLLPVTVAETGDGWEAKKNFHGKLQKALLMNVIRSARSFMSLEIIDELECFSCQNSARRCS